ncbi:PREDICTED: protein hinderin isoform X1 [Gavialis gangeticus]|uniref:protein hinderin isoform X1 n=1 Tax=Gavialis gangeticus TaxID=94835 RepID=UPI00092ECA0E|nr:PREDICTED: protein hinderin isoform X1 [Gavialis gangeticus]
MAEAAGPGRGLYWSAGLSDEEQPVVYVPGISAEGNLRTRHILRAQKAEAKLKVPAAATTATMDPIREPTGQQVTNEGGMKSASLKDLCPEDKRRIANLIKELARVSEEKEVTEERLKAEQESFEKKIRQLEEQNELIIKEREALQQQYRECQELLSLYQKYLAEQQEKLSASLTELGAARQKEQQVSNKKSPCQPPCLELDGSYLGVARQQTLYKNSKASKSGSPTLVSVPWHCRNNHVHGTTAQYKQEEVMDECLVGNGLQRKCNNMMSSTKQRSPYCKELAQDTEWGTNEFQSTCPHQAGHCCAYREGGSSDNTHSGRQVSHVPRRHCGPQYEGCDYLGHSHVSGLNDSMDSGSKEMEHSKRLSEERRQQLLLQKLELEIEKERLQHLLAKQEAKLLLKQQQLHQSRLDYNRFRGQALGSEEVAFEALGPAAQTLMNGTRMGLSMPTSKGEDYSPRTPTCNKASRSSAGSSSGKKTVGFNAAMEKGPLWMQTKEETSRSGKGTASGSRKDAATSPALTSSRKELVTTATSPIQHDTSRYEDSLLDLVEAVSPVCNPGQCYRESPRCNKAHAPCHGSHRKPTWYQGPCDVRSRADDLEESQLLEEIFFI